ncbi:50S ribosomal protein L24 [bacterium]|nr:50S ribosomal protein L24 [bacterium]
MSLRIKKNDMVMVISGKDKAATGRVLSVQPKKGTAIVEGVNIIKKHQKARNQNEQGGIVEREAPILLSKLMLADSKGRAARFGVRTDAQGVKQRVLKLEGEKDVIV